MGVEENTEPFNEEEFPFPLTAVDRHNLSITDAEFKPHTWAELKHIIAENKLETLRRWPSDLKRYIKWSAVTKREYGSIMVYVMQERLRWTPSSRSTAESGPLFDSEDPTPFQDSRDFRIMPNDWPYGLEKGIAHIIVWLKNRLEVDSSKGDLIAQARAQVDAFVHEHFVKPVMELTGGTDNVIWFKNWVSLQSVPGIDHVHVLLKDVPQDVIDQSWTKGERPVQNQISVEH